LINYPTFYRKLRYQWKCFKCSFKGQSLQKSFAQLWSNTCSTY